MVNSIDFINRLKKIMDYYQLSPSSFADKIQVQRSSISHILSGRNKPSLDFVLKITDNFPQTDLYWLLNGKGIFPKNSPSPTPTLFESKIKENSSLEKNIQKIVVFYNDGTFEEFNKR